jgi:hypothetical protein
MVTTTDVNDAPRMIAVLHPTVPLPDFAFFQVVKVKTTKEVGTVIGMWCFQADEQSYQWAYRLEGLRTLSANWWQGEQLRSLQRRRQRSR